MNWIQVQRKVGSSLIVEQSRLSVKVITLKDFLSSFSVTVFVDWDLGTGVDEKKEQWTQVSSETRVLYLQKYMLIYLQ